MNFRHHPRIWTEYPELAAGALYARGVRADAGAAPLLAEFEGIARSRLAGITESELPEIQAWRRTFSKMGLKPTQYRCASEALLRRFRKERSMPSFHPMVDYLNYVSMAYGIPIAAYDSARIAEGITVRPADGSETYVTFQGETEHPEPNEIVFADEEGNAHSRRWTFRQSARSVVSPETDRVLIVAEALHPTAHQDLLSLEQELQAALPEAGVRIEASKHLTPADRRFDF